MVFKELEIQGFKSFPDKVKITFDEGVTGVVGPNGSGKSTLAAVLAGNEKFTVTEGSATFLGQDLLDMPIEDLSLIHI